MRIGSVGRKGGQDANHEVRAGRPHQTRLGPPLDGSLNPSLLLISSCLLHPAFYSPAMHLFTPALAVACLLSLLTSLIAANRGPELPSYQELLFDKQLGTGDTGLSRYATSMLGAEMRNMTLDYYCRQSRAYNCL